MKRGMRVAAVATLALVVGGLGVVAQAAASEPPSAAAQAGHAGHQQGSGSEQLEPAGAPRAGRDALVLVAYNYLPAAQAQGYSILTDLAGKTCIDQPGVGGMGVHYVNGGLVGDPAIVARQPEAVVYQPATDGRLQLVAVEYVTIKSAWDANHSAPPALFGHEFMTTDAPNRTACRRSTRCTCGAWDKNPDGTFAMWNLDVVCP